MVDVVVRVCGWLRRFGVDPERVGLMLALGIRSVHVVLGLAAGGARGPARPRAAGEPAGLRRAAHRPVAAARGPARRGAAPAASTTDRAVASTCAPPRRSPICTSTTSKSRSHGCVLRRRRSACTTHLCMTWVSTTCVCRGAGSRPRDRAPPDGRAVGSPASSCEPGRRGHRRRAAPRLSPARETAGRREPQTTQNSLPSGSSMTTWSRRPSTAASPSGAVATRSASVADPGLAQRLVEVATAADLDVEVDAVLDRLALRHLEEADRRPVARGRPDRGAVAPLLLGHAVVGEEARPVGPALRRRSLDVAQGVAPERAPPPARRCSRR